MTTLPRLRTAVAVVALIAGSLSAAVLTSSARVGAASGGGATIYVQTMDSCHQIKGSAEYALTGGGASAGAVTPSGSGTAPGSGCPVPTGGCSLGPCAVFNGVADGTYRIVTTKTPPPNASNPEGYAPCEGGSACRSQVADLTVSGGSVSATVTNVYPNNKVTALHFSGSSGDPIVFHDFGLAKPGSGGFAQCDGDSDADDHSTGSPSGSCGFSPESAEATACQPFPWSCTMGNSIAPPSARHLSLTLPAGVDAFAPFSVTVTALSGTAVDPTFKGTVNLSSASDKLAGVPAAYTFTAADAGAHTFTAVLRHTGSQGLAVTSKGKGSIGGATGTVTVAADAYSFVENLYHDILGRLGADTEVAYWVGQMPQGGRQAVATAFTTSPEVYGRDIDATYQQLVGQPAGSGRDYWVSQLSSGGHLESLIAALAATGTYYSGHGRGTDAGSVTALYHDILGRTPAPAELSAWLARGPLDRGAVASGFAFSHEHHLQVADAWYTRYLGRGADSGDQYWATLLDRGTNDEAGVAFFTGCDEYYAKAAAY